jgi:hypothetical protein
MLVLVSLVQILLILSSVFFPVPEANVRSKIPFEPIVTSLFSDYGVIAQSVNNPFILNIDWGTLTPSPSGAVVASTVSFKLAGALLDDSTNFGGSSTTALSVKIGESEFAIPKGGMHMRVVIFEPCTLPVPLYVLLSRWSVSCTIVHSHGCAECGG